MIGKPYDTPRCPPALGLTARHRYDEGRRRKLTGVRFGGSAVILFVG